MVNLNFSANLNLTSIDEVFKYSLELLSKNAANFKQFEIKQITSELNFEVEENIRQFPMIIKEKLKLKIHNNVDKALQTQLFELLSFESQLYFLQNHTIGLMRHGEEYLINGDHFKIFFHYSNPYLPQGEWLLLKVKSGLQVLSLDEDLRNIFELIEEGYLLNLLPQNKLQKALGLGILFKSEQKN